MLRVMRKYQKGVLGLLAILFVCMAMAGFGIDMFMRGAERKAITVNDDTVDYASFYREVRQTRERYVQMFGARFSELAKSFNLNLQRQVVDQMINGLLVEQEARLVGLTTGDEELRGYLEKSFNGDRAQYANFLRTTGYSAPQFEEKAKKDLLREQFSNMLKLASFASRKEAEALLKKEETKVDVRYVEVRSKDAAAMMPVPDDTVLKAYFENNTSDFQTPAAVSFQYVALGPLQVANEVMLSDEDIAFYLSENEARFSNPARAKIRHIEILFPKNPSDAQQKETREKAEAILKRAKENEPFDGLVMEASDDITTKMLGGDVGWIDQKSADPALAAKVFALKGSGIAELVTTASGFKIVKVDQYEAATVKEMKEVRAEIEKILRAQEAPAYAAARAQELYGDLKSGKITLADVATKYMVQVATSDGELTKEKDPTPALKGLTAAVLDIGDQKLQIHEIGDASVLVSVAKYVEPSLPPFDAVRQKVVDALKKRDGAQAAENLARTLLTKVNAGEDMKAIAEGAKLSFSTKENLSKKAVTEPVLSNPALVSALFEDPQPGKALKDVYKSEDGFVIVAVAKVTPPSADDIKGKIVQFQEQAGVTVAGTLTNSLLNRLKTEGKVDFDQSILTE